mmetsp:Transcript_38566/g.46646  ORF Transcript_38566/g.46646 Transcript_38566/m.46646 type:complete len:297 (+) Transcript_38566:408-1298(+)
MTRPSLSSGVPSRASTKAGCAVAAIPWRRPLDSSTTAGAAHIAAAGRPASTCDRNAASNAMQSRRRSAPGMPPGMAIRSKGSWPGPTTSVSATSATTWTPRDMEHWRRGFSPSCSTEANTTSAPALRNTSTTVTVSISSLPSATGTSTRLVSPDAPSPVPLAVAHTHTAAPCGLLLPTVRRVIRRLLFADRAGNREQLTETDSSCLFCEPVAVARERVAFVVTLLWVAVNALCCTWTLRFKVPRAGCWQLRACLVLALGMVRETLTLGRGVWAVKLLMRKRWCYPVREALYKDCRR